MITIRKAQEENVLTISKSTISKLCRKTFWNKALVWAKNCYIQFHVNGMKICRKGLPSILKVESERRLLNIY